MAGVCAPVAIPTADTPPSSLAPSVASERPDDVMSPWNWLLTRNRLLKLEKKLGYSCIWWEATEGASGAGGAGRSC